MPHRLFIAIDLPSAQRETLARLSRDIPGARRVRPEQLHLTLHFLGEMSDERLPAIREALEGIRSTAFPLALHGIGAFPSRDRARVVWAGIAPSDGLFHLRVQTGKILQATGLPLDPRPFSPHITLARLKTHPTRQLAEFFTINHLFASPPFPITTFHLYASTLTPEGPLHTLLQSYPLD